MQVLNMRFIYVNNDASFKYASIEHLRYSIFQASCFISNLLVMICVVMPNVYDSNVVRNIDESMINILDSIPCRVRVIKSNIENLDFLTLKST